MDVIGEWQDQPVHRLTLGYPDGIRIALITFGASLTECWVPDREGQFADVVLGWDTLADYINKRGCLGATCGRYANRIADGRFELNGNAYRLETNEGPTTLHGGPVGFHRRVWSVEQVTANSATLSLFSEDGDQGFPGNVAAKVIYTITGNFLTVTLSATVDRPTVLNMTNHAYWSMAEHNSGGILEQVLTVPADAYLPVDDRKIPLGHLRPVDGSASDFRVGKPIGQDISDIGGHYDHNWCLSHPRGEEGVAAVLFDPSSGRRMTVSTTEPGVQLYTAAHFTGDDLGKCGAQYKQSAGLAIEPQNWPDSPNQVNFPSAVYSPDLPYHHTIKYKFERE
ncbi:MAG: aldose epimerase family protein [Pseudomonadota bacterium]